MVYSVGVYGRIYGYIRVWGFVNLNDGLGFSETPQP